LAISLLVAGCEASSRAVSIPPNRCCPAAGGPIICFVVKCHMAGPGALPGRSRRYRPASGARIRSAATGRVQEPGRQQHRYISADRPPGDSSRCGTAAHPERKRSKGPHRRFVRAGDANSPCNPMPGTEIRLEMLPEAARHDATPVRETLPNGRE